MADRGKRLVRVEEGFHEADRFRECPEDVRIHLTAGQHERVIVFGLGILQQHIHVHAVAPVSIFPALDRSGFRRHDMHGRPGCFERFLRLEQFRLLEPVGREDGYFGGLDIGHAALLCLVTQEPLSGPKVPQRKPRSIAVLACAHKYDPPKDHKSYHPSERLQPPSTASSRSSACRSSRAPGSIPRCGSSPC